MIRLRPLPIDVMKIDRSFVKDLGDDAAAMAMARTIVALAKSLDLKLVAAGVETDRHANALRSMHCDELQGYLYSTPVPPEAISRLPNLRRLDAARRPSSGLAPAVSTSG
jgi:EAL domain-containing protein (putative c-di-GMP-specific phosphodiesterase class I)